MVSPFGLARLPEIQFGEGKASNLAQYVSSYGKSFLLVSGAKSLQQSAFGSFILESFAKSNYTLYVENVSGEPSPVLVDSLVEKYRNAGLDAVISIGGGSVIDCGKAVAAMLTQNTSVMDFLEDVGHGKIHNGESLPFIAVPTTAGTGSEATKNAVLGVPGDKGFKKSLRHANFTPRLAIVDPELSLACPPGVTAASGLDALCQLIEAYTSKQASEIIDALALSGIACASRSLSIAFSEGLNRSARSDMAYAALVSGICLANAGLGAVHGFASSIGGLYTIPHGVICGTLLGVTTRANVLKLIEKDTNAILPKFAAMAYCFDDSLREKPHSYSALVFCDKLDALIEKLQMPKLRSCGIGRNDLSRIARETAIKNNPVGLTPEELEKILVERL
jgi:alcohol dehydrogenase class IV